MKNVRVFAIDIVPVGLKWRLSLNGVPLSSHYLLNNAKRAALRIGKAVHACQMMPEDQVPKGVTKI